MKTDQWTYAWSRKTQSTGAFTLVQLLVIVAVTTLLATLGTIAMQYTRPYCRFPSTLGRIQCLATGSQFYYEDTNRRYYPGQQYPQLLLGNGGKYTGSQYLALCLFSPRPGSTGSFPMDGYYSYTRGDTPLPGSAGPGGTFAIADFSPDQMAICYYVSRGQGSGIGQFLEADNAPYTNPNKGRRANFTAFITNPATNNAYNDGSFLLIAPGRDRKYFTEETLTNFK